MCAAAGKTSRCHAASVLLPLLSPPTSYPSRPELLIRQQKRLLNRDAVLLAVDDPKPNIGSGSAALNALICVAEYLAAHEGHKVGN